MRIFAETYTDGQQIRLLCFQIFMEHVETKSDFFWDVFSFQSGLIFKYYKHAHVYVCIMLEIVEKFSFSFFFFAINSWISCIIELWMNKHSFIHLYGGKMLALPYLQLFCDEQQKQPIKVSMDWWRTIKIMMNLTTSSMSDILGGMIIYLIIYVLSLDLFRSIHIDLFQSQHKLFGNIQW